LYLAFTAQWANKNLDQAEKMTVGGVYTVRAYDLGVISGDKGYLGTAEFRHNLGSVWAGQWQAVAFIDSAHITINKNVWTTAANNATLSGAGLGLNWAGSDQWSARMYIAKHIGAIPLQIAGTTSTRAWIEISKGLEL
jgi:hemolysin activation/secretion protein